MRTVRQSSRPSGWMRSSVESRSTSAAAVGVLGPSAAQARRSCGDRVKASGDAVRSADSVRKQEQLGSMLTTLRRAADSTAG